MMIAPHADPRDGRFECVALGDLTRTEVVGLSAKIYQGAHLAAHDVKVTSGTRVEAEPLHPWASVLLDVDGEQPGKLPVKATHAQGGAHVSGVRARLFTFHIAPRVSSAL